MITNEALHPETRILVVENKAETRLSLEQLLRQEPYEVDLAASGEEALELALEHEHDLFLINIQMPEMDGFELADYLRGNEKNREVPLIFITADHQDEEQIRKAFSKGGTDHVCNPLGSPELLKMKLRTFLRLSQQQRSLQESKTYTERVNQNLGNIVEARTRQLEQRNTKLREEVQQRRQFEETLRMSEQSFRQLFENASDAIFIIDHETHRFIRVNQKALEQLGYKEEELTGMPLGNILENPDLVQEELQEVREKGAMVREHFHVRKDGSKVPVEVSATQVEFQGKPAIQSFVRDITERKRMEKLKAISFNIGYKVNRRFVDIPSLCKDVYEELAELMPINNFFIALNHSAEKTLEFPFVTDDRNSENTFHPRSYNKGFTEYTIRQRQPVLLCYDQIQELTKQGEVEHLGKFPVKCFIGIPLKGESRVIGILGVVSYEIKEEYTKEDLRTLEFVATPIAKTLEVQLLQNRLIRNEKHFRTLIERSSDLISVIDARGKVVYMSPSVEKILGYPANEMIGGFLMDHIHPDDEARFSHALQKVSRKEPSREALEYRFRHHDGKWIFLESVFKFIRKNKEEDIVIINSRDISERKEMEKQALRKEMIAGENERKRIGADLHDGLGQTLTAINMYWEIIRSEMEKAGSNQSNRELFENTSSLIEQAITETRAISHNLMPNTIRQFGLELSVNEMLENIRKINGTSAISFNSHIGETRFPRETEIMLFRMVQELVNNALKYSQASHIQVDMDPCDGGLYLSVRDDGVGFDVEEKKATGKGAGLSTIENRMRMINGRISFISDPGEGTRVDLVVPLEENLEEQEHYKSA